MEHRLKIILEGLDAAQRLIDKALPEFNWKDSALTAEAVQLINETPGKIAKARDVLVAMDIARDREAAVRRFMSNVVKLPNGCWFWTGARSRGQGNRLWYGSFRVGPNVIRAHRFAAEVLGGQDCPEGYHRDHICNFSLCVNPAHLKVVSAQANQQLKMERKSAQDEVQHPLFQPPELGAPPGGRLPGESAAACAAGQPGHGASGGSR